MRRRHLHDGRRQHPRQTRQAHAEAIGQGDDHRHIQPEGLQQLGILVPARR